MPRKNDAPIPDLYIKKSFGFQFSALGNPEPPCKVPVTPLERQCGNALRPCIEGKSNSCLSIPTESSITSTPDTILLQLYQRPQVKPKEEPHGEELETLLIKKQVKREAKI